MHPTAEDIYVAARAFIGVRWRHQGRTAPYGLDCVGLLIKTAHAVGLYQDFEFTAYKPHTNYEQFITTFRDQADEVPRLQAGPGMAVIIPTGGTAHCGLLGMKDGQVTLIHAYALRKKVVEEAWTVDWQSACKAAFKLRGVDY